MSRSRGRGASPVINAQTLTPNPIEMIAKIISEIQRHASIAMQMAPGKGMTYFKQALEHCMSPFGSGVLAIATERQRQIEQEGWTPEHDDHHDDGQLAHAAAWYAINATGYLPPAFIPNGDAGPDKPLWPWEPQWQKPSDNPIRDLEKAGALIAAEIDRLKRAES